MAKATLYLGGILKHWWTWSGKTVKLADVMRKK